MSDLIEALRAEGAQTVVVEYAGAGDSGDIEAISATDGEGNRVELDGPMRSRLCEWTYDILPPGWEINEGSSGTVTIDCRSAKAQLEHRANVVEVETSAWELHP